MNKIKAFLKAHDLDGPTIGFIAFVAVFAIAALVIGLIRLP